MCPGSYTPTALPTSATLLPYDPRQVSHGRQPGAECVSQARNQAAMEAVEGARQRREQCARRVMRGASVLTFCLASQPSGAATCAPPSQHRLATQAEATS